MVNEIEISSQPPMTSTKNVFIIPAQFWAFSWTFEGMANF